MMLPQYLKMVYLLIIKEKGKVKITVYSKETKVKKTYKIKTEEVPQISFGEWHKANS